MTEALCFGWIDSTLEPIDEQCCALRFSPRRENSVWSMTNIRRVEKLTKAGRLREAWLAAAEEGWRKGQRDLARKLEEPEEIPPDLERALQSREGALEGYQKLRPSRKNMLLHWIYSATQPATRQIRITVILQKVAPGSSIGD